MRYLLHNYYLIIGMLRFIKFWHRWKEFANFVAMIVAVGSVCAALWMGFSFISTANATAATVVKITKKDTIRDKVITRTDYNVQLIAQKLKLPLLIPSSDEKPLNSEEDEE